MPLADRLLLLVQRSAGNVVLRSDLASLGSASQVSRALNALLRRGDLVRIGLGIYAKTRVSSVTGAVIPAGTLEGLSVEALQRLGVELSVGSTAAEYNSGRTTQMPGKFAVKTGKRRIRRRITVGGRQLSYEP